MTNPFIVAQLRIWRLMRMPDEEAGAAALRAAATAAGHRIVEVHGPAGEHGLTLAWQQPSPLTPKDPGGPPGGTERDILTLAACLHLCWPDPDQPILPGVASTLDALRDALKSLGVQQVIPSVNRLSAWGYLETDLGDGTIRLGPAVATWTDTEIAQLRRQHATLPGNEDAGRA
ncbi:hypothetical protein [Amycolatopsis sp. cmx-4-61]|uniref:hypothetical protein n=1 Tax=Amycolatopsis sp. cmx-4-61 TaxID=2790937 RepID=UPI00397823E6